MRYATGQIFAGAILVNNSSALLINCVEPYGRLSTIDAHHERTLINTMHQSSFPGKKKAKYGSIDIFTTNEDSTTKLKIGTNVSNVLVTSSVRIDGYRQPVEIGSKTSNFLATPDTHIFLNIESLKLTKAILEEEEEAAISVHSDNYFFQL